MLIVYTCRIDIILLSTFYVFTIIFRIMEKRVHFNDTVEIFLYEKNAETYTITVDYQERKKYYDILKLTIALIVCICVLGIIVFFYNLFT